MNKITNDTLTNEPTVASHEYNKETIVLMHTIEDKHMHVTLVYHEGRIDRPYRIRYIFNKSDTEQVKNSEEVFDELYYLFNLHVEGNANRKPFGVLDDADIRRLKKERHMTPNSVRSGISVTSKRIDVKDVCPCGHDDSGDVFKTFKLLYCWLSTDTKYIHYCAKCRGYLYEPVFSLGNSGYRADLELPTSAHVTFNMRFAQKGTLSSTVTLDIDTPHYKGSASYHFNTAKGIEKAKMLHDELVILYKVRTALFYSLDLDTVPLIRDEKLDKKRVSTAVSFLERMEKLSTTNLSIPLTFKDTKLIDVMNGLYTESELKAMKVSIPGYRIVNYASESITMHKKTRQRKVKKSIACKCKHCDYTNSKNGNTKYRYFSYPYFAALELLSKETSFISPCNNPVCVNATHKTLNDFIVLHYEKLLSKHYNVNNNREICEEWLDIETGYEAFKRWFTRTAIVHVCDRDLRGVSTRIMTVNEEAYANGRGYLEDIVVANRNYLTTPYGPGVCFISYGRKELYKSNKKKRRSEKRFKKPAMPSTLKSSSVDEIIKKVYKVFLDELYDKAFLLITPKGGFKASKEISTNAHKNNYTTRDRCNTSEVYNYFKKWLMNTPLQGWTYREEPVSFKFDASLLKDYPLLRVRVTTPTIAQTRELDHLATTHLQNRDLQRMVKITLDDCILTPVFASITSRKPFRFRNVGERNKGARRH